MSMTPRHTRSATRMCLLCADNVEMIKFPWRDINVYVTRCVTWQNALFFSYFPHSVSCWDEAGSLWLTRTSCWSQTATLFHDSSSCAVDYHTACKEWQREMLMWTPDPRQAQNRKIFLSKSCTKTQIFHGPLERCFLTNQSCDLTSGVEFSGCDTIGLEEMWEAECPAEC